MATIIEAQTMWVFQIWLAQKGMMERGRRRKSERPWRVVRGGGHSRGPRTGFRRARGGRMDDGELGGLGCL